MAIISSSTNCAVKKTNIFITKALRTFISNLFQAANALLCGEEFGHLGSTDSQVGDLVQVASWVGLGSDHVHAGGCDEHRVQSFSAESHWSDLGNWEGDFSHILSSSIGWKGELK